jgi:DNA-directed RNA polymerase specialized sigma24 family protein
MEGDSDVEVAAALAAGDVDSLAQRSDRYGPLASLVPVRILGDPGKAEDVAQDAFLKLRHGAARFHSHRGSLWAWVTPPSAAARSTIRVGGAPTRWASTGRCPA